MKNCSDRDSTEMKRTSNIRYRSLLKITGWLIVFECVLMVLPLLLSVVNGDIQDIKAFAAAMALAGVAGGLPVVLNRKESIKLNQRESYLLISTVWIAFSLFGMLPFMMCSSPVPFADAFFEAMSGFTTTGASVYSDVESLGKGILLWRAMIQWLGGLGIVFFLIAILPALNNSRGTLLFNVETTGISHDKIHPHIRKTASSLWTVYSILTLALATLLLLGGMDIFDSICVAMSTLSTGGFSTRNEGIAYWHSGYIASVMTVFMIIGGINFIFIYNTVVNRFRRVWKNEVVRIFLATVLTAGAVTGFIIWTRGGEGFNDLVLSPLFHVSSAITSTGFSYSDFGTWGNASLAITMMLMICGACAGSTSGGIKIDRIAVMFKTLRSEITYTLFPNHLNRITVGDRSVDQRNLVRILAFCAFYILITGVGALLMSAFGYDLTDSFFASASCIGNSGLGYGTTAAGYGGLPGSLKMFLSFEMLVGRLEIFTVFVLFYKSFWK